MLCENRLKSTAHPAQSLDGCCADSSSLIGTLHRCALHSPCSSSCLLHTPSPAFYPSWSWNSRGEQRADQVGKSSASAASQHIPGPQLSPAWPRSEFVGRANNLDDLGIILCILCTHPRQSIHSIPCHAMPYHAIQPPTTFGKQDDAVMHKCPATTPPPQNCFFAAAKPSPPISTLKQSTGLVWSSLVLSCESHSFLGARWSTHHTIEPSSGLVNPVKSFTLFVCSLARRLMCLLFSCQSRQSRPSRPSLRLIRHLRHMWAVSQWIVLDSPYIINS